MKATLEHLSVLRHENDPDLVFFKEVMDKKEIQMKDAEDEVAKWKSAFNE
jgi:hypothetical protein